MNTIINSHIDLDYTESGVDLYINAVNVDYKYRGKGLFRELVKDLIKEYKSISLICWPTLTPMYRHLGFIKVGETEDGYDEMILKQETK